MKKIYLFLLAAGLYSTGLAQFADTLVHIDFENGQDSIVRVWNYSGTSWQWGIAQKPGLGPAYSPVHAAITDTLNPYQPGTHTVLDIPFVPTLYTSEIGSFLCPVKFCFRHKMDVVESHAGGWVEFSDSLSSYNMASDPGFISLAGGNYSNLFTSGSYAVSDLLFNGEPGFRVSDSSWTNTCMEFVFWGLTPPPDRAVDTLHFRLHFVSDTTANPSAAGWMVDEIMIGKGTNTCGGAVEENASNFSVYPNPTEGKIWLDAENLPVSPGELTLRLFDAKGLLVKVQCLQGLPAMMDLGELPKGLYLLDIQSENAHIFRRIVYP